jgi:hypothetical protein
MRKANIELFLENLIQICKWVLQRGWNKVKGTVILITQGVIY